MDDFHVSFAMAMNLSRPTCHGSWGEAPRGSGSNSQWRLWRSPIVGCLKRARAPQETSSNFTIYSDLGGVLAVID